MSAEAYQLAQFSSTAAVASFVRGLSFADLPDGVVRQAKRCVLDLVGTGAMGCLTPLSRIIRDHVVDQFNTLANGSRILFDGRRVSPAGAALAGGMIIDSFDAHDGHALTKGHAGAAVLPGLVALGDSELFRLDGREFLTALVVGYEIAIRAGIATHRIAPDYHTSGSWNALGVAAVAARLLPLEHEVFRHALGIAEYHGPRSQMMRCIDYPTMVKDGSGWGAMTGLSAAYLARSGFTGAPALVVEEDAVADIWNDLGQRWRILEMYLKPYPVCRWAQPAIAAVLELRRNVNPIPDEIAAIEIHTFHEATRLSHPLPHDTEQAQYSVPFPVAAALLHGSLSPAAILSEGLADSAVRSLSCRVRLIEDPHLSARFPAERFARAILRMRDGREFKTADLSAVGDPHNPLSDQDIGDKFAVNAEGAGLGKRASLISEAVEDLDIAGRLRGLLDLILTPLPQREMPKL